MHASGVVGSKTIMAENLVPAVHISGSLFSLFLSRMDDWLLLADLTALLVCWKERKKEKKTKRTLCDKKQERVRIRIFSRQAQI